MAKPKPTRPDCPQCSGNRTYLPFAGMPVAGADTTWRCHNCGAEFEPDDEGGDYFTDPTKRIEKREERAIRENQKRRERMLGRRGG